VLFTTRCAACDRLGPSPCASCHAGLRPPAPEPDPPGLDGLVSLLRYDGPARPLVARIKYRNQRATLDWLASGLADRVRGGLAGEAVDLVTWAPTTSPHRRRRGFDHGELLARAVARRLGVPARRLLTRDPGPAQTGRPARARRQQGPCFRCPRPPPTSARVLVVDDVVTTGATLRAATQALRRAGCRQIVVACAARTPATGRG
jgi:ComF family protein